MLEGGRENSRAREGIGSGARCAVEPPKRRWLTRKETARQSRVSTGRNTACLPEETGLRSLSSRNCWRVHVRAEVSRDRLRIEVEDGGGPWRDGPRDDGRPHGFDVVTAIAGAGNWGIGGDVRGRIAWARLGK